MLTALIIIGIIGYVFAVPSPDRKAKTIVEHHHHHVTVIERPAAVQAQIHLIKMEIVLAEAKMEPERVRLPEARLLNPTTAIERYRSHERKPS